MASEQQQRPITYGDTFGVEGHIAEQPITREDAALMQTLENMALGSTPKGGAAASMQSAADRNVNRGVLSAHAHTVVADEGMTIEQMSVPGVLIQAEYVAGEPVKASILETAETYPVDAETQVLPHRGTKVRVPIEGATEVSQAVPVESAAPTRAGVEGEVSAPVLKEVAVEEPVESATSVGKRAEEVSTPARKEVAVEAAPKAADTAEVEVEKPSLRTLTPTLGPVEVSTQPVSTKGAPSEVQTTTTTLEPGLVSAEAAPLETMPPATEPAPVSSAPKEEVSRMVPNPVTIGEALGAAAISAGDSDVEDSDARAIQSAETLACRGEFPGKYSVGAIAQHAAAINEKIATQSHHITVSDVLTGVSDMLLDDKVVTQEDAAKVRSAELRGRPTGVVKEGGVADSMQAAADVNELLGVTID
ncbi:hypothetical protein KP509_07G017000 [Ceratopteris richardii]|uniref:SMP domain-containing protein n=1 Tax=Ceratopteris richardii TaxID=49495 RepID=A0A8T2UFK9_CERRI|nr:hypothetical protein KP509_07G017000 [Ceratopteris richardii]